MSADYTFVPAEQSELDSLHQFMKVMDPGQEGLTLDRFRAIYPKMGWHDLLGRLNQLKEAGKATRKVRTPAGAKQGFDYWTWQ